MANVTVKLFGVLKVDTCLDPQNLNIDRVEDIFPVLNKLVDERFEEKKKAEPSLVHPDRLAFKDALVFVNGERCPKKKAKLNDGDEVWLLSPASGG